MRKDPDAHFMKLKAKIKLLSDKKYQEDLLQKEDAEKRLKEPVVEIKDKFGRVMSKVAPKMTTMRLPSVNRMPRKKEPPKRLRSFTEMQLQYYADEDIYNPMQGYQKPSLTDLYVINSMKECDRFPIPESLLGRKPRTAYSLRVDSLMSQTYAL